MFISPTASGYPVVDRTLLASITLQYLDQLSHEKGPITPATGLTLSVSSAAYQAPVVLTATVTGGTGTPTGTVMFYDGITLLGSSTVNAAGVESYTISTLTVGTHSLSAKYLGDMSTPRPPYPPRA